MDKALDLENPLYFILFFEDRIKSTSSAHSIYNEGSQAWYGQEHHKKTWKLRPIVIFSISATRFCKEFLPLFSVTACLSPAPTLVTGINNRKIHPKKWLFFYHCHFPHCLRELAEEDRVWRELLFSTGIMHFVNQVAPQSQFKAFLRSNHAKTKM